MQRVEGPVFQAIRRKLNEALQPTKLVIVDESYLHAGHAAMKGLSPNGETHFRVEVESASFLKVPLVSRHRMVFEVLAEEMKGGIHALSIQAKAPSQ